MRTVEREMIAAIRAGKSRKLGNTVVEFGTNGAWRVLLFGKHIASGGGGKPFTFTLAGWPTNTTRSRLNALFTLLPTLASLYQSKGGQYFRFGAWGSADATTRELTDYNEWITPYAE